MALRTNSVEYAFPLATATVASATARDFTTITVAIPENSSRTFRSVILQISAHDLVGTAADLTAVLMGISIDAVARNDATVTQTLTNSNENQTFILTRDVTSYFQTNFTGTSHTVGCRLTVTGLPTSSCTAKLIITYEFQDSAQTTRLKTVRIPMDGYNGNLTNGSLTNMGGITGQIPALDTWLPEASKTYRDIFFETWGQTGTTTTGDATLTMRFYGTTDLTTVYGAALNSDRPIRRIDKLLATLPTNAAQTVSAQTNAAGSLFPCLGGMLVVTYEYDHSTTTTVMNSLLIPAIDESGWVGGPTTADRSRFLRTVRITEPTTITLQQSGVIMTFNDAAGVSMDVRCGAQSSRVYTVPSTQRCGGISITKRFDSGAAGGGAGYTFVRGSNDIVIDFFSTSSTSGSIGSNVSGLIILNYTSGKATEGTYAHNHTTFWTNRPYTAGLVNPRLQYTPTTTPTIPETEYFATSIGYQLTLQTSSGNTQFSFSFLGEIQSAETANNGAGWLDFYTALYATDAEIGPSVSWARARDDFKRWPGDSADRVDLEVTRDYRFDVSVANAGLFQVQKIITYHAMLFPIEGAIFGSGGADVTIIAYRISDGTILGQTSRTGDGVYSIPWYDDYEEVVVVAYASATLEGSSKIDVAGTGDFDVDLSNASAVTYYAYA